MGGVERASANIANGLSNAGYEVILLTIFKRPHFFQLNSEIILLEPENFNKKSINLFKSVVWIKKNIYIYKPDQVIAFVKLYSAITAIALLGSRIPLYISERSSPLYRWPYHVNIFCKLAFWLRPPEGVLSQTKIAAESHKLYYRNSKIHILPNAIRDVKTFPEIKREKMILAVGRIKDYLKGFDILLNVFSLLENKDWELLIVGGDDDDDDKKLNEIAVALKIKHRVKFLRKTNNIDLYFARSGIFVMSSRSEGFPNALAEAMAAGCCCVAFDFIAGPRDIIIDKYNGYIVPDGDINEMTYKLDFLIKNDEIRRKIGEKAMDIMDKLSIDSISNKLVKIINDDKNRSSI